MKNEVWLWVKRQSNCPYVQKKVQNSACGYFVLWVRRISFSSVITWSLSGWGAFHLNLNGDLFDRVSRLSVMNSFVLCSSTGDWKEQIWLVTMSSSAAAAVTNAHGIFRWTTFTWWCQGRHGSSCKMELDWIPLKAFSAWLSSCWGLLDGIVQALLAGSCF